MANELYISYNGTVNIYAVVRRMSDGKVWNTANSAFETWASGTLSDYDILLTDETGDLYQGNFPSSISAGLYGVHYYLRAGASPATSDTILEFRVSQWDGANLGSSSSVTLSAYALTSLESAKRYLHITNTTSDTLLTELINALSGRIERQTGRLFLARDYRHWINGSRQRRIALQQYPLIEVTRFAYGNANAISASYSGSAIRAMIQVTETAVQMRSITAAGVETETNLLFATYPTNSTMATAISLISGWSATVQADAPSLDLCPMGGRNAKSQTVMLCYPDQDVMDYREDRENGIIAYIPRGGSPYERWSDDRRGYMGEELSIPRGFQYLLVQYRAGYETIPDDLAMLCNELVAEAFNLGRRDTSIRSESLGDYSYTLSDLIQLNQSQLDRMVRWSNIKIGKM